MGVGGVGVVADAAPVFLAKISSIIFAVAAASSSAEGSARLVDAEEEVEGAPPVLETPGDEETVWSRALAVLLLPLLLALGV